MPTRSKVFRVMIGSPSDLAEERLAATAAVNEWNAQHADAEGTVLLPVRWETHAMPASGVRPNRRSTISLLIVVMFSSVCSGLSLALLPEWRHPEQSRRSTASSRLANLRCCISPNGKLRKTRPIPHRRRG